MPASPIAMPSIATARTSTSRVRTAPRSRLLRSFRATRGTCERRRGARRIAAARAGGGDDDERRGEPQCRLPPRLPDAVAEEQRREAGHADREDAGAGGTRERGRGAGAPDNPDDRGAAE